MCFDGETATFRFIIQFNPAIFQRDDRADLLGCFILDLSFQSSQNTFTLAPSSHSHSAPSLQDQGCSLAPGVTSLNVASLQTAMWKAPPSETTRMHGWQRGITLNTNEVSMGGCLYRCSY